MQYALNTICSAATSTLALLVAAIAVLLSNRNLPYMQQWISTMAVDQLLSQIYPHLCWLSSNSQP